jgi:hypothetical protein
MMRTRGLRNCAPRRPELPFKIGVPTGIRTPVLTVKGWCPRPLDDGDADRKSSLPRQKTGGARRDRTADLLHAMQALSQLSYGPTWRRGTLPDKRKFVKKMNGLQHPPVITRESKEHAPWRVSPRFLAGPKLPALHRWAGKPPRRRQQAAVAGPTCPAPRL